MAVGERGAVHEPAAPAPRAWSTTSTRHVDRAARAVWMRATGPARRAQAARPASASSGDASHDALLHCRVRRGLSGEPCSTAIAFTLCLARRRSGSSSISCGAASTCCARRAGPFTVDRIRERIRAVLVDRASARRSSSARSRDGARDARRLAALLRLLGLHRPRRSRSSRCSAAPTATTSTCRSSAPDSSAARTCCVRDLFEAIVFVCIVILIARWAITRAAAPHRLPARGGAPAEPSPLGGVPHPQLHRHRSCCGGLVYDGAASCAHAGDPGVRGARRPGSRCRRSSAGSCCAGSAPGRARDGRRTSPGGLHNLAVLVMLNFLPLAKHFHVITSLPNVFFRKLEPIGAALQAGPRERDHLRHLAHRPVHLEAGAGHVQLHRVRALLVAVPGDGDREAARAAPAAARPARLPLRAPGRGDREARCSRRPNGDGAEPPAGGREHRRARSSRTRCCGPATSAAPARSRAR